MLGIAKPAVLRVRPNLAIKANRLHKQWQLRRNFPVVESYYANDKRKVEFCGDGLTSAERAILNEQLPTTEE